MNLWLAFLLSAHLLVSGTTYYLLRQGKLCLPRADIAIVLLVPGFGLASLLGSMLAERMRAGKMRPQESDRETACYGSIAMEEDESAPDVVPLEEALFVNDAKTRRSLMLNLLHNEPLRHMRLLKTACLNGDMEVAHYAATTIMEVQREFDLTVQKMDRLPDRGKADPCEPEKELGLFDGYISSGLLDGHSLKRIRMRYDKLLAGEIALKPDDRKLRLAFAQNKIELKEYEEAEAEITRILERWPSDEEIWLLGVRLAVERQDKRRLDSWMARMDRACPHWSPQGKEIIRFWQARADTADSNAGRGAGQAL